MSKQESPPQFSMGDWSEALWRQAMTGSVALPITQQRCALMPSQRHCFHEQLRLWDDLFPPAMVCCWCGEQSGSMNETPLRHGPHVPEGGR
jgi:hypothetical protein